MISPKKLKTFFSKGHKTKDSAYFLKSHIYMEAYLKRVMLIGLRLQGVQYKKSEKIILLSYFPLGKFVNKAICLLDSSNIRDEKKISLWNTEHPDFFLLRELVLNFSAKYRNQIVHGTIDEMRNQELIDCLCHTNISFVEEFECTLDARFGKSAFAKPRDWGANQGINEEISNSVERLKLRELVMPPMSLDDAKESLKSTKYKLSSL